MEIDLNILPFSFYGSYLVIARDPEDGELYLYTVHGDAKSPKLFKFIPASDGQQYDIRAYPWCVELKAESWRIRVVFRSHKQLVVAGDGCDLQLRVPYAGTYSRGVKLDNHRIKLLIWEARRWLGISTAVGGLDLSDVDGYVTVRLRHDNTGKFVALIEEGNHEFIPKHTYVDVDEVIETTQKLYSRWEAKLPSLPDELVEVAKLAWYVLWVNTVAPEGYLQRYTVICSKRHKVGDILWANGIWAWDHCFHAIALRDTMPELAWEQFMVMFDHQATDGKLPDYVKDTHLLWAFTKPPCHGWAYSKLMQNEFFTDRSRLCDVLERLEYWTNWWFTMRDDDSDGICQYNFGVESGWDNATVFDTRDVVETPDLNAYLVLQLMVLSEIAERLGKPSHATRWHELAIDTMEKLLSHLWEGDRFVSYVSGQHRKVVSNSLINYMPIVLGDKLPDKYFEHLVKNLCDTMLTPNGIATEAINSDKFNPKGYWRGPIWAPVTHMVVDGLQRAGRHELAREIARRFCKLISNSPGMYENYNPITGEGNDVPAYGWTAACFIAMAHEYLS